MTQQAKIVSRARLKKLLKNRRSKTVVFTNGCFDILHAGHVTYLAAAKKKGDILVVGLNSDASVRRLKGRGRPVTSQQDRAIVLAALACVDFITIFEEDTPLDLIKALCPDVLVKGGDWKKTQIIGASCVSSCGGRVLTLPFIKGRSTSGLLKRIKTL